MRVYANSTTLTKLWSYIEEIDTEVGGFGFAQLDGSDIVWDEVFLVPQMVSHSEVEFDGGGINHAIDRAAAAGVLDRTGFVWVSWHSHHTLGAFWSQTDEKCVKTYGDAGIPYLLSFVGCHNHDYEMRFDSFGVKHAGLDLGHVTQEKLKLERDCADDVFHDVFAEIRENVRKQPVQQWTTNGTAKKAPDKKQDKVEDAFRMKALMAANPSLDEDDAREILEWERDGSLGEVDWDAMAWGGGCS